MRICAFLPARGKTFVPKLGQDSIVETRDRKKAPQRGGSIKGGETLEAFNAAKWLGDR